MEYQTLFSPMKIGNTEIKNRVVMTAMGVDVSDHDGAANEKQWHIIRGGQKVVSA